MQTLNMFEIDYPFVSNEIFKDENRQLGLRNKELKPTIQIPVIFTAVCLLYFSLSQDCFLM